MIKAVAARRFNSLDVLWLVIAVRGLFDGHYLVAGLVMVVGALCSVALERHFKRGEGK